MTQILQQNMPRLDTPLTNSDGTMNYIWYQFFLALWKKSGLGATPNSTTLYNRIGVLESKGRNVSGTLYPGGPNASVAYYSDGPLHYLNVYDIQTGQFVGTIQILDWFGP